MNKRKEDPSQAVDADPCPELDAALLADADFLDAAQAQAQRDYPSTIGAGLYRSEASFPQVRFDAPEAPAPAASRPLARPAARAVAASPLLAQLKQAVSVQKMAEAASALEEATVRADLGAALRGIFDYLLDLSAQLNHLRPPVPREYLLLNTGTSFQDLAWHEGFTGNRSQADSNGELLERVTLNYRLLGTGVQTIERSGAGIERLRQQLFDLGLKMECRERRNQRRELEHALFVIPDEIGVQVLWRADFARRVIVLEMSNVERLGRVECSLAPASVGPALLDEFGRLLLGQPNRFRDLVSR